MNFVIYCPGMPFHGGTLEQGRSLGGSESAAYYLARELARQGNQVTVFTQISREEAGMWEGVRYCAAGPVTPQTPLGADFQWYAAMTPHDVLILQRVPNGFQHRFAAKVNLWWSHDLALKRFQPLMSTQLWNVDRLLAVSEFHRGQMAQVYNFPADRIAVVPNGVDPELFDAVPLPDSPDGEREAARKIEQGLLIYSSRPERGLELLVGPGGVMERLLECDPELTLRVAGYDNTAPNLRPFYEFLWGRCQELPNVELVGPLSKKELADLMRAAWLHLYPTVFEEVSCISVMESQAAGTPVITSNLAALPETLRNGGAVLLEPELPRLAERCVAEIAGLRADRERWDRLHRLALQRGRQFRWGPGAETVLTLAEAILREKSASPGRLARHLLRHSDILACRRLIAATGARPDDDLNPVKEELERHYGFQEHGTFGAHYEAFAQWQNERGIDQGHAHPERLLAIPRFRVVEELVGRLPQGACVLDYGCGQGHFTVVLAEKYPHLEFLGIDVAPSAIAIGQRHSEAKGLTNIRLFAGQTPPGKERFDLVLACEVLEHVPDPGALADRLEACLAPGGAFCLTVPYGPWEAESFAEVPFRAHLHHLERANLVELFGQKPDFKLLAVPARLNREGEPLGVYQVTFTGGGGPAGRMDVARKLVTQSPRETLSVCMVCREDGVSLAATLESVRPFADQVVIGFDSDSERNGPAWEIARRYGAEAFALESPLKTGFDVARNRTVARANGDWVLWIDDDEIFEWPSRLPKYLRPNSYDAYAVKQHHYAVEPEGVIKTDFPCRIFRRNSGFRFFGVVHEHPEFSLNGGAGRVLLLPDVAICHHGYETEEVRRERFHRNLPLMIRDREEYPDRLIGKFLWIRDLAHLNRYAREGGGGFSPRERANAHEAVRLWRELLEQGHVRMAIDALPYYSEAVELLTGEGIQFEVAMGIARGGVGDLNGQPAKPIRGYFLGTEDIRRFTEKIMEEKTAVFEEKYF